MARYARVAGNERVENLLPPNKSYVSRRNLFTEGWDSRASGLPKNSSAGFPRLEMGPLWFNLGWFVWVCLFIEREKDQIIHPKMEICNPFYNKQPDWWAGSVGGRHAWSSPAAGAHLQGTADGGQDLTPVWGLQWKGMYVHAGAHRHVWRYTSLRE